MPTTIGIIGGSGLYDMAELTDRRDVTIDTPFGPPSAPFVTGRLAGKDVVFLAVLPHNATGKIHKPTLRKQFSAPKATDMVQAAS